MAKKYISKIKKGGNNVFYLKDEESRSSISQLEESKQDVLTFDSMPTLNSQNPILSGGVYAALQDVEIEVVYSGDFQGVVGTTTFNNY